MLVSEPTDHSRSSLVACSQGIVRPVRIIVSFGSESGSFSAMIIFVKTDHAEDGAVGTSRSEVLDKISLFSFSMPSSVTESRVFS